MAKRTAHGLNEIRKLVNVEEKIILTSSGGTPVVFDFNGVIVPLTYVAQGTDYTNRVGDSIKLQKLEFKAAIVKSNSSITTTCRCIIFRDLDNYGTIPAVTDLMQVIGAGDAPLSAYKFLNRKRFSILYDELLELCANGDQGQVIAVDIPHSGHVLYLGSAANAASQGKGGIYVLFISNEGTNYPTYTFYNRIIFTDD